MPFFEGSGATSLFVSGVSLEYIRMFGLWGAITFREYLRFGDLQYRHLSDLVVNSEGLTDQLRLEAGESEKFASWMNLYSWNRIRLIVVGTSGIRKPFCIRGRSPGSSPEPRIGPGSKNGSPHEHNTQEPIIRNLDGPGRLEPYDT